MRCNALGATEGVESTTENHRRRRQRRGVVDTVAVASDRSHAGSIVKPAVATTTEASSSSTLSCAYICAQVDAVGNEAVVEGGAEGGGNDCLSSIDTIACARR